MSALCTLSYHINFEFAPSSDLRESLASLFTKMSPSEELATLHGAALTFDDAL